MINQTNTDYLWLCLHSAIFVWEEHVTGKQILFQPNKSHWKTLALSVSAYIVHIEGIIKVDTRHDLGAGGG